MITQTHITQKKMGDELESGKNPHSVAWQNVSWGDTAHISACLRTPDNELMTDHSVGAIEVQLAEP